MVKVRGFEKITIEQWEKDNGSIPPLVTSLKYENLVLPKRATAKSAGYDVFSPWGFTLNPGEDIMVPTGFKVYMLQDEMITFYPRSSFGFKYYIHLANTVGIGDSDYYNNTGNEGHYWVKIRNTGTKSLTVKEGDAFAQAIFQKYLLVDGDWYDGELRVGGIGSTNKTI